MKRVVEAAEFGVIVVNSSNNNKSAALTIE